MVEPRDSFDNAEDGDPLDPERMLRSIERMRLLPPAVMILSAVAATAAVIYWLIITY